MRPSSPASMDPEFGWTVLSRDDLQAVEAALKLDNRGVLDEIGFLMVHQGYANRFFPGTSVLHTRLRYVMFLAWTFQEVLNSDPKGADTSSLLQDMELTLAERLKEKWKRVGDSSMDGIIGRTRLPHPVSQPPSIAYWTALLALGIVREDVLGRRTTLRSFLSRLEAIRNSSHRLDAETAALREQLQPVISTLPRAPTEWHRKSASLSFALTKLERKFLKERFGLLKRPDGSPALLARLATADDFLPMNGMQPWSRAVQKFADAEDKRALINARRFASLAAIGRALYAHLAEKKRNLLLPKQQQTAEWTDYSKTIHKYGEDAMGLNLGSVEKDIRPLDPHFRKAVEITLRWLNSGKHNRDLVELQAAYADAEHFRKGRRARLVQSPCGEEAVLDWNPEDHAKPTPLHYRWSNIIDLLSDLRRP